MAKFRPANLQPPDGRLRKSQLVGAFGPGALIDLLQDAVLVSGLDFWPRKGLRTIEEPRLRDAIAAIFEDTDRTPLAQAGAFREPPPGDDREPRKSWGVAVLEFPRWFVCQGKNCRALVRSDGLTLKNDRYVHMCDSRGKPEVCVPVRFVVACRRGHLDDFPWKFFVHAKHAAGPCAAPSMKLKEGRTGDFAEVTVECACGARRRLVDASVPGANPKCQGARPWLGPEGHVDDCTEQSRLLVRTASNGYFAQVVSALSIPEGTDMLRASVQKVWATVQNASKSEDVATLRKLVPDVGKALGGASDDDVAAMIATIKKGEQTERAPIRTAEFETITAAPLETAGELPKPSDTFFARRVSSTGLPPGIARIIVAPKLREVRVQIGFTRLESASPDMQGAFDLGVESSALGLQTDWLPASEVMGEGIFLQLDEKALQAWEKKPAVVARARQLLDGYEAWTKENPKAPPFPGTRFYLLHSLSHMLMSALALECGYASTALHERIYSAGEGSPVPMAALLISTGTPGAEGTLGGLVEQGRRMGVHLRRALDSAKLCSNDPVCAAHSPRGDLAERFREGAACHGCLFVAEPSCERFNQYLDRALVVPTLGQSGVAFFS